MFFLTQRCHAAPQGMKINSNYFIFMPKIKGRDFTNIATDQAGSFDTDTFKSMS